MYKVLQLFVLSVMTVSILLSCPENHKNTEVTQSKYRSNTEDLNITPELVQKDVSKPTEITQTLSTFSHAKQQYISDLVREPSISEDDIILLAYLAVAESGGECEDGQRLVIDSVLNRMTSEHFPDTVPEVIYQKFQYSCTFDGRMERCEPTDRMIELVKEEIKNKTNSDVIFFTAGQYSKYGTQLFQLGNHYFSSY